MKFLWIFDIDGVYLLIPMISFLFAAGGSGPKYFRKLCGPMIGIAAFSIGFPWFASFAVMASFIALTTIPYGSGLLKALNKIKMDWAYFPCVYFIGAIYAASLWPLAIESGRWLWYGIGSVMTGIVFGTLMLTSQKLDFPKWKFVEIVLGACIGGVASYLMFK